jgi:KaiC/GvpD/RAD55 family RecA-like ATPase
MSSAVVSTSAARGRPFVFDEEDEPAAGSSSSISQSGRAALDRTAGGGCPHLGFPIAGTIQSTINNKKPAIPLTPASRLEIRPAPEMVSSGVTAIDALTGGLPRGCLTEICGPASSGRTTLLLAALAAATCRGEFCAVVDASDALDPQSAADAGVDLERLLWVRCGEDLLSTSRAKQNTSQAAFNFNCTASRQSERCLEQVLRATDLLLESGGFGLIVLDLADLAPQAARRIPLTTWFRFRRAIEPTPTMLVAIEQQAIAGSCSSLLLQLGLPNHVDGIMREGAAMGREQADSSREAAVWESRARPCRGSGERGDEPRREGIAVDDSKLDRPSHAYLLTGLNINAELTRSRLERKPARSVVFATKTAWAG